MNIVLITFLVMAVIISLTLITVISGGFYTEPATIQECILSHKEEYTYLQPHLMSIDSNGIPHYIYIPTKGERTICDEYQEIPNPRFIKK